MARFFSVEVDYYSGKAAPKTLQLPVDAGVDCDTTAKDALQTATKTAAIGATLVVRCPAQTCASGNVYTSDAGQAYLFTSSICRAAVHAGVITDGAGGAVQLTLGVGAALSNRPWSGA